MNSAFDQFFSFVASERNNHARRMRFAGLMCIVILALLYRTEWIVLRSGLAVLLAGQAGVVIALFFRNNQLRKKLDGQKSGTIHEHSISAWFEDEESFVRRLALFETAFQTAGFVLLGYEFWVASRSLWLALGIGVVYPAAMYAGIHRRRNSRAIRELAAKRQAITAALSRA